MRRDLFSFTNWLWRLLENTEQNKTEIKEIRKELRDLTAEVRSLAFDMRRLAEHDSHEREKLVLRLENELLRFERRLPEPKKR